MIPESAVEVRGDSSDALIHNLRICLWTAIKQGKNVRLSTSKGAGRHPGYVITHFIAHPEIDLCIVEKVQDGTD